MQGIVKRLGVSGIAAQDAFAALERLALVARRGMEQ